MATKLDPRDGRAWSDLVLISPQDRGAALRRLARIDPHQYLVEQIP